ncbi:PREDICTED: cytosolic sulfotransferase 1-like [Camelina sativa]|uniref:ATP-dependent DNA helicase n=1 Tax=Camelina sativa TaxID=90675 RepID=A0ABM1QI62_CAMSA|nr:PREDICTED: cytosolic sulfotransferase 1-like [Camelina sativa]
MMNKLCYENLDRSLRDIMRCDQIFGGKVVVVGGDFRQILHVITEGGRVATVLASINSSVLWNSCKPCEQVMRLAEFLGCPFTQEEIHSRAVKEILELCSLHNLSNLDINKTAKAWDNLDHNVYFRKGEVDGWKNHFTSEMENIIDMIINEKFQGSGLKI